MMPDASRRTTFPWGEAESPYEEIGGASAVRSLADHFYDRIDASAPTLRAMLPRDDSVSREKLFEFLSGWMGGPNLYMDKRGHPRLRMRHLPFPIGTEEVEEWLRCMGEAMDELAIAGPLRAFLDDRFTHSAHWMRNR